MPALIGRNTRVEVEATLDTAKTLTAISKASTGVATSAAHGYTNGDVVVMSDDMAGMVELAGQIVRVANVATNTFELEGFDTTGFGTFTSGTVKKILTWATLGEARSVSAGGVGLNRLESTTLLDAEKQYVLGQSETPEITIEALSNPFAAAAIKIETTARSGGYIGFRLTLQDSSKRIFRGQVSLPSETIQVGDLITASYAVSQVKRRLAYAT